jgi:hypothetical protein
VIPPIRVQPRHHIAFRYYRLAQTTDDLFDAYRNMYLAFELLLSSQHPVSKGEREIDWLRRALGGAAPVIQLAGLGVNVGNDPVASILDVVYRDARLPLFHAKEGRNYFAPLDSASDRAAVSHALSVLTRLVLRMAQVWFDAPRTGGGVFLGWIYQNIRTQLADCSVRVSNYDGPFDASEADLSHPRFQTAAQLTARLAPEFQRGREPALFAVANGVALSPVQPVRRIEIVTPEHPVMSQILDTELDCDGVARFEVLMHARGLNVNQPKSLFRR